jgi:hypothetical protein
MQGGCYYLSIGGSVFGWTQSIPLLVGLCCTVLTIATGEAVYFLFALYLYIPQWIVWCFQYYFQYVRPNPVCQLYHTWAFPSMEAMYVGAIVGALFTYAYFWRVDHGWITWLFFFLFATIPPIVLINYEYNRWWEVLFSLGFGALSSVLFVVVLWFFVKPKISYLKLHFPFYIMGYTDTMIKKTDKKSMEILAALERLEGL